MFPTWFERRAGLTGAALLFLAVGLVHALVSRLAGPALALDDDKINLFTQSFQFGYLPDNPPLFEWTLIVVQQAAGPTLLSFLIVKYLFLLLTGCFTFFTGRIVINDNRWALLATIPLLTIYQFGYNYHQAFTHSTALMATVSLFWYAFALLGRRQSVPAYLLLGLSLGLGALAKYTFFPVAAAAVLAGLLSPSYRNRLLDFRALLALGAASVVFLPHALWQFEHSAAIVERAGERLQTESDPYLARIAIGLPAALWAIISFFLPFLLIAWLAFKGLGRKVMETDESISLYRNACLIGAAIIIVSVFVIGATSFAERYVIAFMYPGVFWIMGAMKSLRVEKRDMQRYLAGSGVFAVLFLLVRAIQLAVPGAPFCSDCRQWTPYEALADGLAEQGYTDGAFVAFENHTAGNLRRLFPENRVLSAHMPFYTPKGGAHPCYFIWSTDLAPPPPQKVIDRLDADSIVTIAGDWDHPLREKGWRQTIWHAGVVPAGSTLLDSLCRPVE